MAYEKENALFTRCKSVTVAKDSKGIITVNAVVPIPRMGTLLDDVKLGDSVTLFSKKMKVTSIVKPQNATVRNISLSTSEYMKDVFIKRGISYQTVPNQLFEISKYSILSALEIPSVDNADLNIKIKQTKDIYGNGGWTARSILKDLSENLSGLNGVQIKVASIFDYDIVEFGVSTGTPLTSVISSLYPIPGMVIQHVNENLITIDLPPSVGSVRSLMDSFTICQKTSESVTDVKYDYLIEGLPAEPKYILGGCNIMTSSDTTPSPFMILGGTESSLSIQINKIGGIFSILERETEEINYTAYGGDFANKDVNSL